MGTHAIVIFADIRGFTQAVEKVKFSRVAADFMQALHAISQQYINGEFKPNGDGFIRLLEIQPSSARESLEMILAGISKVNADFEALCRDTADRIADDLSFALGWGISRGDVLAVAPGEWVGSDMNMAARLCDCARPSGLVINARAFRHPPEHRPDGAWHQSIRRLTGIGDVRVWESATPHSEFQPRERRRESPEVHVAGICWRRRDGQVEILLSKRADGRALYGGRWEGCGGQLAYSEDFHTGVSRHFRTEMGLTVRPDRDCYVHYVIEKPNTPIIPGVRFLCEYIEGSPQSAHHSAHKWVTVDEFRSMDESQFPESLRKDVLTLLTRSGLA